LVFAGTGIIGLAITAPVGRLKVPKASVAGAFVLAGLTLTLLPALAPSSKADEIRYHMLAPKRIVEDGGFRAYREPWEAAIYPHMGYQMTEALTWAWGLQDAANLWGWWMTLGSAVLIAGSVRMLSGKTELSLFAAAIAVLSLHAAVNLVTAGSHAFGDLAMLAAVVLALLPEDLVALAPFTRVSLVSIATCATAVSKISVLPVSLLILALAIFRASKAVGYLKSLAIAVSIWTVGYLPLVIWSTLQTGSPFGVATARLFHSGFFGGATLARLSFVQHLHRFARPSLSNLRSAILESGACMVASIPALLAVRRMRAVVVVAALQFVLIAAVLPKAPRFMGGLQLAVLIVGISSLERFRDRHVRLFLTLGCLCLLAIEVDYTRAFGPVALGFETRTHFLARTVPFMDDFPQLDRSLPADAVLYAPGGYFPGIYSPRTVAFNRDDIRKDQPVFLFSAGRTHTRLLEGCGDPEYTNDHAVILAFRTRPPLRGIPRVQRCTFDR
jgi:hypothetical protein